MPAPSGPLFEEAAAKWKPHVLRAVLKTIDEAGGWSAVRCFEAIGHQVVMDLIGGTNEKGKASGRSQAVLNNFYRVCFPFGEVQIQAADAAKILQVWSKLPAPPAQKKSFPSM